MPSNGRCSIEAELLLRADKPQLPSGAAAKLDHAYDLKLAPFDKAQLPTPPERMPKTSDSTAGFVTFEAPAAGSYQITLTDGAWIDIVQGGHAVKPAAFSGATDCPGVRKSIRFALAAQPFTIQISRVNVPAIGFIVEPEGGAKK